MKQEEKRELVKKWMRGKNKQPLEFINTVLNGADSLDNLVLRVLLVCISEPSINSKSNAVETRPSRRRSVFDIWRHILYVKPDVDIFDTMEAMHRLRKRICGSYCGNVERTVFHVYIDSLSQFNGIRRGLRTLEFSNGGVYLRFTDWEKMKRKVRTKKETV